MQSFAQETALSTIEAKWCFSKGMDVIAVLDSKYHANLESPSYGGQDVSFKLAFKCDRHHYLFLVLMTSSKPVSFWCDAAYINHRGERELLIPSRKRSFEKCDYADSSQGSKGFVGTVAEIVCIEDMAKCPAIVVYATVKYHPLDAPLVSVTEQKIANFFPITAPLRTARAAGLLTDCVLKVGNRRIQAHRFMLAAHSEAFAAMFTHQDTIESQTGEVAIEDAHADALEAMVDYLYGASPERLNNHVAEVLQLADRFRIQHLRDQCYELLESKVTEKDFCQLLSFAYLKSSQPLIALCAQFIKSHRTFLDSKDWKDYKAQNPQAAFVLLEKML